MTFEGIRRLCLYKGYCLSLGEYTSSVPPRKRTGSVKVYLVPTEITEYKEADVEYVTTLLAEDIPAFLQSDDCIRLSTYSPNGCYSRFYMR